MTQKKWTPQDVETLKAYYASDNPNPAGLSEVLGRTRESIKCKACKLGIVTSSRLPKSDYDYIRNLPEITNIRSIAKAMNRSWNTVRKIINELGYQDRYKKTNETWHPTPDQIEIMKTSMTLKNMSQKFGHSQAIIMKKIQQMGLGRVRAKRPKKEKEFKIRIPRVKKIVIKKEMREIEVKVERNTSGIDRIRLAMERINQI